MTKAEIVAKVGGRRSRFPRQWRQRRSMGDNWFHHPGHTRRRQRRALSDWYILRCQKGSENGKKPPDRQGDQDSGKEGSQVLRGSGSKSGSRRQGGGETDSESSEKARGQSSSETEKEVNRNIGLGLTGPPFSPPQHAYAPIEVPTDTHRGCSGRGYLPLSPIRPRAGWKRDRDNRAQKAPRVMAGEECHHIGRFHENPHRGGHYARSSQTGERRRHDAAHDEGSGQAGVEIRIAKVVYGEEARDSGHKRRHDGANGRETYPGPCRLIVKSTPGRSRRRLPTGEGAVSPRASAQSR